MEERLFESNSRDFASPSAAAFRNGPLLLEQLEQLLDRLELKRQTRLKVNIPTIQISCFSSLGCRTVLHDLGGDDRFWIRSESG